MDKKLKQIKNEALELCAPVFHEMEEISLYNTQKVLEAFRKHHLSAYHFAPSYGTPLCACLAKLNALVMMSTFLRCGDAR